ncbi:MAG TPA: DUF4192 family protein, partial [Nocardioidaceae bacterium]|nr:DUF4192 family protein [Nocardioidaceae bacterium]
TPYDPSRTTAAALAVSLGMAKASSRSALAGQFAQRDDAVRATVNELARAALVTLCVGESPDSVSVDELVRSALASDPVSSPTLGRLLAVVQDLLARDVAWFLMTRGDADRHYELWRQVMIMADDDLMAPAGTLCAFAAWLSGRGALASTAAERVAQVRPDYPFLELIIDILVSGMSPDRWEGYRRSIAQISAEGPSAGAVAGDAAG